MRKFLLVPFILLSLSMTSSADSVSVSLDHIDGLYNGDTIYADMPVKFYFRLDEYLSGRVNGSDFGFVIYGRDSLGTYTSEINWSPVVLDTVNLPWKDVFDFVFGIYEHSVTGNLKDTVSFGGLAYLTGSFLDFQGIAFTIEFEVASEYQGYSICIDSSATIGGYSWARWTQGGTSYIPDWGGPYCFTIGPGCCRGYRGNANLDYADADDIGDLVFMISYMFAGGPEPLCFAEADITADGVLDISEIVFYVDYFFTGGPPPISCP